MKRKAVLPFLLLLLAGTGPALGCRFGPGPRYGEVSDFQVLAVRVTGVHLTGFESEELRKKDADVTSEESDDLDTISPVNSTPEFSVHVLVDSVLSGESEPTRTFSLGGCFVHMPTLRESGLILVAPDGRAFGVWASEGDRYTDWVRELGIASTDEP